MEYDKSSHVIKKAFFEKDSTVDYIGVVQGIPVCFDAKECKDDRFPLKNIHIHQVEFMRDFEKQDGISFILINFTTRGEYYYLPFRTLDSFVKRARDGKKSFNYNELDSRYFVKQEGGALVHYLEAINTDLLDRK